MTYVLIQIICIATGCYKQGIQMKNRLSCRQLYIHGYYDIGIQQGDTDNNAKPITAQ